MVPSSCSVHDFSAICHQPNKPESMSKPHICLSFAITALFLFDIASAQESKSYSDPFHVAHEFKTKHIHSYRYTSPDDTKFIQFQFNVTKCPEKRFIEITDASGFLYKAKGSVTLYYDCPKGYASFLRTVSPGAILFFHHSLTHTNTERPLILRVESIEPSQEETTVDIQGEEVHPFEVFQHADISFESNVLDLERNDKESQDETCLLHSPDVVEKDSSKPQKESNWFPALNFFSPPLEPKSNLSTNSTTSYATGFYSSGQSKLIRPMKPWHIMFPNRPLRRQNFFRWMCTACNITIYPTVRFQLRIEDYKLQKLTLVVEGTALFSMSPELRMDYYYTKLKRTIGSYSWRPLYLTIGGIPFEIQPKVRLDLRILALVNVIAPLRFTTIAGGSFEGGVEYSESNGLTRVGVSNFVSVPKDFILLLGKTFSHLTGPNFSDIDVYECAQKCSFVKGCVGFRYQNTSRNCTITTSKAEIQRGFDRASDWTFERREWIIPTFHPMLTGAVRVMLQPILTIDINRVGGPVVSIASGTAITFLEADSSGVTFVDIRGHIHFYVGGLIYLRIGSRKIFNRECLPELLKIAIYRIQAPKQLSIGKRGKYRSSREIPEASTGFFTHAELTELIARAVSTEMSGGLDSREGDFLLDGDMRLGSSITSTYIASSESRGARLQVAITFDIRDGRNVQVYYLHDDSRGLVEETAQYSMQRRNETDIILRKEPRKATAEKQRSFMSELLNIRKLPNLDSFVLYQPTAVGAILHFKKRRSMHYLERGEQITQGEKICSNTHEMEITSTGEIQFCDLETRNCMRKRFHTPVFSLAFDFGGTVVLNDRKQSQIAIFNTEGVGRFLMCVGMAEIALSETQKPDRAVWSMRFDNLLMGAHKTYEKRRENVYELSLGDSLFPGESLLGLDCALVVEEQGVKFIKWDNNFAQVTEAWKSPLCTVHSLKFMRDGPLVLKCVDGSTVWKSKSIDFIASTAKVTQSGVEVCSANECVPVIEDPQTSPAPSCISNRIARFRHWVVGYLRNQRLKE